MDDEEGNPATLRLVSSKCNQRLLKGPMADEARILPLDQDEALTALDVAGYIYEITSELKLMAEQASLPKLAAALEFSCFYAAEAVAARAVAAQRGKAAPEEAT